MRSCIIGGSFSGKQKKKKENDKNNGNGVVHCEKISFFRFPSDPKTANEWKILCKREDFILKSSHRVCEKHFKSCDIEIILTLLDQKGIIADQVRY